MKPKKRKWEELLQDQTFDLRIKQKTEKRFQRERRNTRLVAAACLFALLGLFSAMGLNINNDEFSNQLAYLVEEYDSVSILFSDVNE
ncbi:hypothetical protein LPTSP4_34180 [Leptospira ryugenii]|uniref:Uncharacterized protein n=1 Tax=Leptospira ryugenii TaxID=1917863 RepID=A0A2P2E4S2_9LEPT|nr:hypothetical protein [Leptospira ryugenii]GBF51880.1 hypothetical protein LPTSP4_34180 [Leptospira ryugenii]